jgi:hypothetical protein
MKEDKKYLLVSSFSFTYYCNYKGFTNSEELFHNLLQHGQNNGEISKNYDPELLSRYFHNTLTGVRVLAKTNYDLCKN